MSDSGDKLKSARKRLGLTQFQIAMRTGIGPKSTSAFEKRRAGLFEMITADAYVFSGDGKHGNPERATLEWLTEARGKEAEHTIHLTYPVSDIDTKRKADLLHKTSRGAPEGTR